MLKKTIMMDSCSYFKFRSLALLFALLSAFITVSAQGSGVGALPTGNEYLQQKSFVIGSSDILDTYLSPNQFYGSTIGFGKWTARKTKKEASFFNYLDNYFRTDLSALDDKFNNGMMVSWTLDNRTALNHYFYSNGRFSLLAGPAMAMKLGTLYNLQNSNNPVQIKALVSLAANVHGIFRFQIGNYPLALNYHLYVPFAGLTFSPEYGQLYYEIAEFHQYSRTIHFASILNCPTFFQILSLDVPIKNNQLRISYLNDFYHYDICNLESDMRSRLFSIGFVHKFETKYNGR
jgi:hypothetical protein